MFVVVALCCGLFDLFCCSYVLLPLCVCSCWFVVGFVVVLVLLVYVCSCWLAFVVVVFCCACCCLFVIVVVG